MDAQCEKLITDSLGNVFLSGGKRLPSRMMEERKAPAVPQKDRSRPVADGLAP